MKNRAIILMYHKIGTPPKNIRLWGLYVSKFNFHFQMWYLKNFGFNVISLNELINIIKNNLKLPPYTVVITFDDGFKDFYQNAYPILKKYNLPATVFLVTDLIDQEANWEDIDLIGKDKLMSYNELMEIHNNSKIEFAPHTALHKNLTKLSLNEAELEIKKSIDFIKNNFKIQPISFAPPYGAYTNEILKILPKYNIQCSLTTVNKAFELNNDNIFEIPRITIRYNNHPLGFIYKIYRIFKHGK